jgi:transcriptional regulator with XRE-family HTH domain
MSSMNYQSFKICLYTLLMDLDSFYVDLGKNLSMLRKELSITQAELADKLGVQQQVIASYEVGRRKIPVHILIQIIQFLHCSVNDLIPGLELVKKRGPKPRIQKELEKIRNFPEEKQKLIFDLISNLS